MAQATKLSPQARTAVAQALVIAYNERNWAQAKASITPDFAYDEVATGAKVTGADDTLEVWKAWADAFPDSKGTIHATHVGEDDTVTIEVTWKGTHKGNLPLPDGAIAPTGKQIEIPACMVVELAGERARAQRHYFDMATLLRQLGVAR